MTRSRFANRQLPVFRSLSRKISLLQVTDLRSVRGLRLRISGVKWFFRAASVDTVADERAQNGAPGLPQARQSLPNETDRRDARYFPFTLSKCGRTPF